MVKYPESLYGKPPPPQPWTWWRFLARHLPSATVVLLLSLFVGVVLFPYVVITVPSGMVGVLWKRFNGYDFYCWCFVGRGTILNPRQLRDEGLHLIWPWDRLFIYNLRLQTTTQTYNAISKDGVNVGVQINIRYQLQHNSVGVLHKFIGPNYLASVMTPEIGSQTREVISQYTAQEVYTSRDAIQEKIQNSAQKRLGAHLDSLVQTDAMEQPDPKNYNNFLQSSIQILDTPVLGIELPPDIVAAINRQTQQYYEIQEFKYRVEREAQESRRKQIEANGIAAFQQTVSQGISDSYLRWRGIEATLALAQSANTKIVIIGSGKDGLPIILGNVDNAPSTKESAATVRPVGNMPAALTPAAPFPKPLSAGSTDTEKNISGVPTQPPEASLSSDPSASNQKQAPNPSAPSADQQRGSFIPRDLSEIEALLSRISEALRPSQSATSSGTGSQPKQ